MPIHMRITLASDTATSKLSHLRRDTPGRRRGAMIRALALLKAEAQGRIYSPAGRARRGIGYTISPSGEAIRGILKARNQAAIFSQRDRRSGAKMPPPKRIFAWLRRTGQDATRAKAFLIARAIGARGVQGRPVMAETLRAKRAEVVAIFAEMLREAVRKS